LRSDEVLHDYYEFFKNFHVLDDDISVLDIGSGPFGMINYFQGDARCSLDPLVDDHSKIDEMAPGTSLVKGVAENLPFIDGSFDVVISTNAIDHVMTPNSMLREVHRVTKERGSTLISVYGTGLITKVILDLRENLSEGDVLHQHHLSLISMVRLMKPRFDVKAIIVGLRGRKAFSEKDVLIEHLRASKILKASRACIRYLIELFDSIIYPPVEYLFLGEKRVTSPR